MSMDFELFRKNLKVVRVNKSLTQKEVSKNCGLKKLSRCADLEDGSGKVYIEEVMSICKYFDVGIDDMLNKKAICELKFLSSQ